MVALSAAFTVFVMTRFKLPVSTSQAVVGSIIGWNIFTGYQTNIDSLTKIVSTWILCPLLAAGFSIILFLFFQKILSRIKLHLLYRDAYVRIGLILVGAFGSYSLGANNIANVMGVFVAVSPFKDIIIFESITISSVHQLFFIGSLAIAVGVYTYSKRVMLTVGESLMKISPEIAFIVVLAQALVLFLFSSEGLEYWLASNGFPTIPLVPLSSSQAVVGAILGVGIIKSGRGLKYNILGSISAGWLMTPIIALLITFVSLFFLKNVFNQEVSAPKSYLISQPVMNHLSEKGISPHKLDTLKMTRYDDVKQLKLSLYNKTDLNMSQIWMVVKSSELYNINIDSIGIYNELDTKWLTKDQINSLMKLSGERYNYKWQFFEELEGLSKQWSFKEQNTLNKSFNNDLKSKRKFILMTFNKSLESVKN